MHVSGDTFQSVEQETAPHQRADEAGDLLVAAVLTSSLIFLQGSSWVTVLHSKLGEVFSKVHRIISWFVLLFAIR
jgi:hypothetical protein